MCVGRCAGLSLLRLLNAAHSHAGEKATGIYTALMAAPGGACSVSAPRESIRARVTESHQEPRSRPRATWGQRGAPRPHPRARAGHHG